MKLRPIQTAIVKIIIMSIIIGYLYLMVKLYSQLM